MIYDDIWYDIYEMIYDMKWYDLIWYIWFDMIYDMIWYDMIYDMKWYDIWYEIIWFDMIYDMIYWGYYTVARTYEVYLQVEKISSFQKINFIFSNQRVIFFSLNRYECFENRKNRQKTKEKQRNDVYF